jgi:uncharacterized protein (DUF1330 family)
MSIYERLTPTDYQLSALGQGPRDEPIVIVCLMRFRARAAYPRDFDGPKSDLTGAQAFERFDEIVKERIRAAGGQMIWGAPALMTVVGPPNERWDEILMMSFPSCHAFVELHADPDYESAQVHWTAALAETRMFACKQG